jgi:sec-independent protein translocase protein TatA
MLAEIFGVDGVIVVIVIGMVLFGSSQIPKLARSLGSAQKEFKQGLLQGHTEGETATPTEVKAALAEVKAELQSDPRRTI